MEKREVGERVTAALNEAERLASANFAAQGRLIEAIAEAHLHGGLAFEVGADAATLVTASMCKTAGAREDLAAAHKRLKVWGRAVGIETRNPGGGEKPPHTNVEPVPLRAVG